MPQSCHCPYLASSLKRGQRHHFPKGASSDAGAQKPSEPSGGGCKGTRILRNWASRGALVTHLLLALSQPLHFTLLGLQHLLHLGAEGQAPGVALGSREVSAPHVWPSPRLSWAGSALPTCHLHAGLGHTVQDVSTRMGVSGQLPWPMQQGDSDPENGRSGPWGLLRTGSSERLPPHLSEQTVSPTRRSARSSLPLPHAGQTWAHCAGSRGVQGWGRGRLGLGAHLGLQLLLLPLYLLLHLLVELLDLAVVVSVPPGRGRGGQAASCHPAAGRGGLGPRLESTLLLSSLCQRSLTPVTLGTVIPVTAPDLDIGP